MGHDAPVELPRAKLWAGYRQRPDNKYVEPQTKAKAHQIISPKNLTLYNTFF